MDSRKERSPSKSPAKPDQETPATTTTTTTTTVESNPPTLQPTQPSEPTASDLAPPVDPHRELVDLLRSSTETNRNSSSDSFESIPLDNLGLSPSDDSSGASDENAKETLLDHEYAKSGAPKDNDKSGKVGDQSKGERTKNVAKDDAEDEVPLVAEEAVPAIVLDEPSASGASYDGALAALAAGASISRSRSDRPGFWSPLVRSPRRRHRSGTSYAAPVGAFNVPRMRAGAQGGGDRAEEMPVLPVIPAAPAVPAWDGVYRLQGGQSAILTTEMLRQLGRVLPADPREDKSLDLVYSTMIHGSSLRTMYFRMEEYPSNTPVLMVIRDNHKSAFGAYLTDKLKVTRAYYGCENCFLFTFHERFEHFPWSGENTFFMCGNHAAFSVGNGDGRFGLYLDSDLDWGQSQTCVTFRNRQLTRLEDFRVMILEVWSFAEFDADNPPPRSPLGKNPSRHRRGDDYGEERTDVATFSSCLLTSSMLK